MFKDKINEGIEHHIRAALKEGNSTIEVNYNADNNKVDSLEKKYSVTVSKSGRDKIRVTGDSAKVWNLAKDFHKGSKPAAEAHPNLAKKLYGTDNPDYTKGRDDQAVAKKKVSDMQKTGKDKFKGPDGKEYKVTNLQVRSTSDVKDYYKGNKEWSDIVDKYKDEIKAYDATDGSYAISPEAEEDIWDWIEDNGNLIDGEYPSGEMDQDGFDAFYDAHFGSSDPTAQASDKLDGKDKDDDKKDKDGGFDYDEYRRTRRR